jgi:ssDNA-binding Zn-finger/Zn-ribbon topoisomerase 1
MTFDEMIQKLKLDEVKEKFKIICPKCGSDNTRIYHHNIYEYEGCICNDCKYDDSTYDDDLDVLVEELGNNHIELREFLDSVLIGADEEFIDKLFEEYKYDPFDLRDFIEKVINHM